MRISTRAFNADSPDQRNAPWKFIVPSEKSWFAGLAAGCLLLSANLSACGDSGCPHSMTILWIPEGRASSVSDVTATDGCAVEQVTDCDGGCAYYYIRKLGDGHCQVTVDFNDGSAAFSTNASMDPNGCLLPQPIYVPET
jgi:hypothetical protein